MGSPEVQLVDSTNACLTNPVETNEYDLFLIANQSRRGMSAFLSLATGPADVGGKYQIIGSVYERGNHQQMFEGADTLYANGNGLGQSLRKRWIEPYRDQTGTIDPVALRRAGAQRMGYVNLVWAGMDVVPLAINGALIASSNEPTTPEEELQRATLYGDTATLVAYTADTSLFASGYFAASRGSEQLANSLLTKAHYGNIGTYALSFLTSGFILGLEFVHYSKTGEMNSSTVLNNTVNMSSNAAEISLSIFLLYKSKEVATEGASLATRNVILMRATSFPRALTIGLKIGRGSGPALGMAFSAVSFVRTLSDDTLPAPQKTRSLWASSLCFVGGGCLLAGALITAPAWAPVATGCAVAGAVFIVAGTVVEFWEPIKHFFSSLALSTRNNMSFADPMDNRFRPLPS